MRILRVLLSTSAILFLANAGFFATSIASAKPQRASAQSQTKSDGVAPPEKKASGWDPDLPQRAKPQQAPPPFIGPYAPGEVFVSDGVGSVDVFKPDGTLLGSLNTGQPLSAGMAFAQTGNLYVTTFVGLLSTPPVGVVQFDINGNLVGPFGNFPASDDSTAAPESILFSQAGDAFVGAATPQFLQGCSPPAVTSGPVPAFEFDSKGNLLNTFTVMGQCRGTDWVELLSDQKTLLYTSEGTSVLSFNVSTNTQNPDFADNLPGFSAFAFRVLPNGNLLVADSTVVVELNSSGQQVMTYTPNPPATALFALNVFEFEIEAGTQDITFTTPSGSASGLAIFGEKLVGTNNLTVTVAGSGTGTVKSTPSGISCPSSCLAPFSQNSNVTLTATAAAGSSFAGFTDNCTPANPQTNPPTCTVAIGTADVSVTATFNTSSGDTLTVNFAGSGSGTVSSNPAGINVCATTCSANFASGQVVTLTATASEGSTFGGWSGAGCSGTGTCVVTVTAATTVTATFNSGNTPVIISVGPGSSSTVNTVPGGSAVFGLVLTGQTGFTGTVQLTCTSPIASITCNIVPSSVTLNGTTTSVAIVVNTFCKGFVPNGVPNDVPTPGGFGTGTGLLLVALLLWGATWTFKKQPRWAVSFGLLIVFGVGMSACSNLAKSPSGSATPPGTYPLVVTATPPSGAPSHVNLTLVVKP
jgi:hypothetical protein